MFIVTDQTNSQITALNEIEVITRSLTLTCLQTHTHKYRLSQHSYPTNILTPAPPKLTFIKCPLCNLFIILYDVISLNLTWAIITPIFVFWLIRIVYLFYSTVNDNNITAKLGFCTVEIQRSSVPRALLLRASLRLYEYMKPLAIESFLHKMKAN